MEIRERRTSQHWAHEIRTLIDVNFPEAGQIVLGMDNLNTHVIAWLCATFPPEEVWRLAHRLEIHHTPKHGNWPNLAELELGVLTHQALSGRIPDLEILRKRARDWTSWRNHRRQCMDQTKKLYPTIHMN